MPRPTFPVLVLLALSLLPACRTVPNAAYCDAATDCQDDWICDTELNRCIPPAGMECGDSQACMRPDEPICDLTADPPVCGPCASDQQCRDKNEDEPYCNRSSGECIAMEPPDCTVSEECTASPMSPICDMTAGICKPCGEAGGNTACEMRAEGAAPLCSSDGACVECLQPTDCDEGRPLCGADNVCAGCTEHDHCDEYSGVCGNLGACVPSMEIIYVQQAGGNDSPTCGAPDATCASVKHALTRVDALHKYILVLDGQGYAGELDVNTAIEVTIIGENATISGASNGRPVVVVTGGADVTLEGVTVLSSGSGANGLSCTNSTLRLKRMIVDDNNNIGVSANNCDLTIERSRISANAGGGVLVTESKFQILNNYILDNGSGTSAFGGIRISNGLMTEPQVLAFNTILNNNASGTADTRGVDCDLAGVSPLEATSNILRGGSGGMELLKRDNCDWIYSNIEALPADLMGMEKNNIDIDCTIAPSVDELPRIEAASMCKERGEPGTGFDVDYDGQPRPDGSETDKPDIGADEYFPPSP